MSLFPGKVTMIAFAPTVASARARREEASIVRVMGLGGDLVGVGVWCLKECVGGLARSREDGGEGGGR